MNSIPYEQLTACPSCDLLHKKELLPAGSVAYCCRCGDHLYGYKPNAIEIALAMTSASLMLFLCAHLLPFISIHTQGIESEIYLISIVEELYDSDNLLLAGVASIFLLIAPAGILLINLFLLFKLFRNKASDIAHDLLRIMSKLSPWNMLEIFLVGVLVALIKLVAMADIELHTGFWAFAALVVLNLLISMTIHQEQLWEMLDQPR